MYRGRLWTVRQFAGFGTAEETNERFRYLLDHGQQGLSTAFDMPSLMGHDSDHALSLGEVGREGVAVDTLDDMQTLFAGIDLGEVSVSMTINAPAALMLAFYVVAAQRGGVPADRLSGTIQADILKEYIAQKEWCFPVDPAMRLCGDMIEWCTTDMPRWHPISVSGYHIREAGSTAAQELAFTLKDGLTYVEQAVERGPRRRRFRPPAELLLQRPDRLLRGDRQVPRGAPDLGARAARDLRRAQPEVVAHALSHADGGGVADRPAAAEQHHAHGDRGAGGVLGGTQSLHTNSYDEALALPTEEAVQIALRTQQVIAHETGVTNTIDPLGGSYFVEALTDRLEALAYDYFRRIDELGGMVEAVKQNFPQREIADASYELQTAIDAGERVVVGVNRFQSDDDTEISTCGSIRRSSASSSTVCRACGPGATPWPSRPPWPSCGRTRHARTSTSCRRCWSARGPTPARARSSPRCRTCGAAISRRPSTDMVDSAAGARKLRVVVAKPGLDGHDRGAKIIARALRDAGMEVIYTGLHQTPEQIVETVIQEDADAVGLSILSGAHMTLVPRIVALLREHGVDDVVVTVGGTIPGHDIAELERLGVAGVFTPGTPLRDIIDFLRRSVVARTPV